MLEPIPFEDILLSYTNSLSEFIGKLNLSESKKRVLFNTFLKELSSDTEIVLQYELGKFLRAGNDNFDVFINKMLKELPIFYPVLHKILEEKASNFLNYLSKIIVRFQKDISEVITTFKLSVKENDLKIIDIKPNLGDRHDGEGTALLILSNSIKLIYKPRNIEIVNSYNLFINWANNAAKIDLKVFNSLNRIDYGWLEFVNHEEVNSENELSEYYFQAGALLMITTLLGSKDYHCENIIACGKNPVVIDHETIIQPYWKNDSDQIVDKQNETYRFSVLDCSLIFNHGISPYPELTGYGIQGLVEGLSLSKRIINPNTINSKRVTERTKIDIIQNNIPKKNNTHFFVNDYKKHFIKGFCTMYDVFLSSMSELTDVSKDFFLNKKVRVLWRPTIIYIKILQYLSNTTYMSNFEAYHKKLTELLSHAYRDKNMKEYQSMLDAEINQLLKGDVPLFSVCSSERFLENEENHTIFQYSCIENIHNRINLLSKEHKQEQLIYINKWMDLKNESFT